MVSNKRQTIITEGIQGLAQEGANKPLPDPRLDGLVPGGFPNKHAGKRGLQDVPVGNLRIGQHAPIKAESNHAPLGEEALRARGALTVRIGEIDGLLAQLCAQGFLEGTVILSERLIHVRPGKRRPVVDLVMHVVGMGADADQGVAAQLLDLAPGGHLAAFVILAGDGGHDEDAERHLELFEQGVSVVVDRLIEVVEGDDRILPVHLLAFTQHGGHPLQGDHLDLVLA